MPKLESLHSPITYRVCGLNELKSYLGEKVHVLSILDPGWPIPAELSERGHAHWMVSRFYDVITAETGATAPSRRDLVAILRYGSDVRAPIQQTGSEPSVLVHCHMGISRSTAAVIGLLAGTYAHEADDDLFRRLREIRPRAWPNSLMVKYLDEILGKGGNLVEALGRHYGHQLASDPSFVSWMARLHRGDEVKMGLRAFPGNRCAVS